MLRCSLKFNPQSVIRYQQFALWVKMSITGLMSDQVEYYVGKLSVSQIPLFMKLSGHMVMSNWKTSLRMLSNNTICLLYQPGATIVNLTGLRWWMFCRKQAESNKLPLTIYLLQSVKRSRYQSIIWKSTNEPIPTIQLLDNHVG